MGIVLMLPARSRVIYSLNEIREKSIPLLPHCSLRCDHDSLDADAFKCTASFWRQRPFHQGLRHWPAAHRPRASFRSARIDVAYGGVAVQLACHSSCRPGTARRLSSRFSHLSRRKCFIWIRTGHFIPWRKPVTRVRL